jgi:ERCC4-related helicase
VAPLNPVDPRGQKSLDLVPHGVVVVAPLKLAVDHVLAESPYHSLRRCRRGPIEAALVEQAQEERVSILGLLRKIAKLGTDPKVRRVRAEIEDAFAGGYHSAIVFTQYTDTMDYLKTYLAAELPDVPIASYSGQGGEVCDQGGYWNPYSKESIKNKPKGGAIRLLICADAAAEGLNFQTCGVVIKLDLPWNPMKMEQQIGRIGQKYPMMRVVNFAY